ncbi:MAG TPA: type II toxin-antitoxin system Phd/YefM family antitoxin [Candidatus Binatia bacterium]|jgi:prevent-host-death family protein
MAKETIISFVKARKDLSRILEHVSHGGQPVIIAKRQKPLAVVVGIDRYRQVSGTHKHLAKVKGKRILKIRGIARGVVDIDEAIGALRRSRMEALTGSF